MLDLLLLWAILLAALLLLVMGWTRSVGALTIAYFLGLSLIHVPGILAFVGNGPQMFEEPASRLGFEVTLVGMAAFLVGVALARGVSIRPMEPDPATRQQVAKNFLAAGWYVLVIGIGAYLFFAPVSSLVPSINAVTTAMATLLVIGLWIQLYGATVTDDKRRLRRTIMILPVLPAVSLVSAGFLGHGVSWIVSILAFLFVISPRRTYFYPIVPVAIFLGLSLFVTYMGQREEIRKIVWNEDAGIAERVSRVSTIVTGFEFLDLNSYKHRSALASRLNQNFLVGAGVKRHIDGMNELVYGDTVPWWALIPRALWPDKPSVGGGGDLVEIGRAHV